MVITNKDVNDDALTLFVIITFVNLKRYPSQCVVSKFHWPIGK